MTDTPPSNVTILSAPVTLTGATLTPGNVSLFSGSATVDLVRLQTDIAYLATAAKIPAGNYTSVTLTFANPSLTIENDMATTISGCAVGAICTIVPAAMPMSATVPLTAFSIASSSTTGLLIDVNLDNLLTPTLGENFSAGTTVTTFTPAGVGAPPVGAEERRGSSRKRQPGEQHIYADKRDGFLLLEGGQHFDILSIPHQRVFDGGVRVPAEQSDFECGHWHPVGRVDSARNMVFEDADNSDAEVEGMITSTNVGSQQFNIVIQTMSAPVSGLSIGQPITVQYSSTQTPFDVDLVHADNLQMSTAGFLFATPADLVVGQQVSIRRNSSSTASQINADRVRLRMTRVTATIQSGLPNLFLVNLPSLYFGHGGITAITAQTSLTPPTIYYEVGQNINSSNIAIGELVSVRGPLFNVSGGRTLVTTKVVVKP